MSKEISQTQETANVMFSDIQVACDKMDESVSESVVTFQEFLDHQGKDLQCDIGTHFSELETYLDKQTFAFTEISGQSNKFLDTTNALELQSTGHTPKKSRFAPLRDIT